MAQAYGKFIVLLTMMFTGLKLARCIDWSWIWVVSPVWISFLLFFCLVSYEAWMEVTGPNQRKYDRP